MRRLLLLVLLWPLPAAAGPWPRAPGEVYLSAGHEGGRDGWTGSYAEIGGPRDLTFGLSTGGHVAGLPGYVATGASATDVDFRLLAFVRMPVWTAEARGDAAPAWLAPWLFAVEAGIGQEWDADDGRETRLHVGASVGRGFSTRFGDGWTATDVGLSGGGGTTRLNVGSVLGIRPTERIAVEMGLFVEREETTTATFAPVVQYGLGRLGAVRLGAALKSDGERSVIVGFARTF